MIARSLVALGADLRVADPHLDGAGLAFPLVEATAEELAAADAVVLVTDHDAFDYELVGGPRRATCSTPATDWTGPTSSGSDGSCASRRHRRRRVHRRQPLPSPGGDRPDVGDVVVLDDLSTGDAANLDGRRRRRAGRGVHPRRRPPRRGRARGRRRSCTWRPGRRCPGRSTDPDGVATRSTRPGTLRVLEAARRHGGAHVVVASSSSVYGANPVLPKSEDLAPMPVSPYAVSKLADRVVRPRLRALLRAADAGLPVLQRLRPAAGARTTPTPP